MDTIYDLSWNKDSFFAKLCLFFKSNWKERKRIKSDDNREKAQGYSALSSTYYSICGTARAKFGPMFGKGGSFELRWFLFTKLPVFIFTWIPLGLWCYYRMLYLSNRAFEFSGGYENMTDGMCDIRQSILRKRGEFEEAKKCIEAGLLKTDIETHTIGLLHVGLANIYANSRNRSKTEEEIEKALEIAEQVKITNPHQTIRIYKHCANITDSFDNDSLLGNDLRKKAENLARKINAKDQILKLKTKK